MASPPTYKEVTSSNGRVYRVGEDPKQLIGRSRNYMVWLPWVAMMAAGVFFGLAGAPAQNAAVQRIVPNEKRGQVSALYLFMFTFFGGLGSWVIGSVSTYVIGDEQMIWKAILITACIFLPTATFFMWRGIRPYREEVERLEALGL